MIELELTPGEKLEIQRRRAGMTQADAAGLFSVPLSRYRGWERGKGPDLPIVDLGAVQAHETARVLRRRKGLTLQELSDLTGFHRQWIHLVEVGEAENPEPLLAWWRRRSKTSKASKPS